MAAANKAKPQQATGQPGRNPAAPTCNPAPRTGQKRVKPYTHVPRPGHHDEGQYSNQLRYGGFHCVETTHGPSAGTTFEVFRDAICMERHAELSIETNTHGHGLTWQLQAELTAPQLEALAFALLDAAADIRGQAAAEGDGQ